VFNDDEPRNSIQISGRVVDASGNGIGGVAVTLSGKQSASALTDAPATTPSTSSRLTDYTP